MKMICLSLLLASFTLPAQAEQTYVRHALKHWLRYIGDNKPNRCNEDQQAFIKVFAYELAKRDCLAAGNSRCLLVDFHVTVNGDLSREILRKYGLNEHSGGYFYQGCEAGAIVVGQP